MIDDGVPSNESNAERSLELRDIERRYRAEALRALPVLAELSKKIHSSPELGFEEKFASSLLRDALADAGFSIRRDLDVMSRQVVEPADGWAPDCGVVPVVIVEVDPVG